MVDGHAYVCVGEVVCVATPMPLCICLCARPAAHNVAWQQLPRGV